MAQLSRPYQVGLVAVALLAAAWLVLLQGHGASPGTSGSASSAPATVHTAPSPKAAGSAGSNGANSKIYHGPAPGVSGLTKDIAKANGAVAVSRQHAQRLEEKSAQASSANSAPSAAKSSSSSATALVKPAAPAHPKVKPAAGASGGATAVGRQHAVEGQLAQGKIVLILFWDAKGADDRAVHQAVAQVRHSGMKIAVDEAGSHQVAAFGTITRGVQVYGTPTLLIVNKSGKTRTLTGLQDAYAITQAIREARHS